MITIVHDIGYCYVMNLKANKACAWSGAAFVLLFLVGFWVIAGFNPPPSPSDSAEEIAQLFRDDSTQIRIGLILTAFAAVLIVPWAAAINTQLRRIEGPNAVWGPTQLIAAGLSVLVFEYLLFFWIAATFREERPAEILQTINDMAWIPFDGLAATAILQAVAIGIAILADKRPEPILPRWVGYANLWCALLFTPGSLNVFFKDGPLAWNGAISWYTELTVFCIWFVINTVVILKAISHQQQEPDAIDLPAGAATVEVLWAEVSALRHEVNELKAPVR